MKHRRHLARSIAMTLGCALGATGLAHGQDAAPATLDLVNRTFTRLDANADGRIALSEARALPESLVWPGPLHRVAGAGGLHTFDPPAEALLAAVESGEVGLPGWDDRVDEFVTWVRLAGDKAAHGGLAHPGILRQPALALERVPAGMRHDGGYPVVQTLCNDFSGRKGRDNHYPSNRQPHRRRYGRP